MSVPKWNDERTNALTAAVEGQALVSKAQVAELAEMLGTTTRSISSKLRKLNFEVETASAVASKFTEKQTEDLIEFVTGNSGEYTYAEIAKKFGQGFNAKQVQGKILSLELTHHVKPSPKVEAERKYTDAECDTIITMANQGAYLEDIADALGKPIQSVRGKALSMLRSEQLDSIPKQRDNKAATTKADVLDGVDVEGLTVEQIAETIGKTPRGVRTMLTRRGISCQDYDGASKKEKAEAAA